MRTAFERSAVVIAAVLAAGMAASTAQAGDPAAVVSALQHTPVSAFTYGLANLGTAIDGFVGRAGDPPPTSVFTSPLAGRIADNSTVTYSGKSTTILINLIKFDDVDGDGSPDQACQQAMAALHVFAGLTPEKGQLPPGQPASFLAGFFYPDGTPVADAANDPAAVDRLFTLRYVFPMDGRHYECRAPFYGTSYTLKPLNF
jgi:hypothetical protein